MRFALTQVHCAELLGGGIPGGDSYDNHLLAVFIGQRSWRC